MSEPEVPPTAPPAPPPPAPPASAPQSFSWETALTNKELAKSAVLTDVKDIDGLVNKASLLVQSQGLNRVPIPTETSGKEVWDHVFNSLGRPENPAGYELKYADHVPTDVRLPEEKLTKIKEKAFELGFSRKQLNGMMEFMSADASSTMKDEAAYEQVMIDRSLGAIKAIYGDALDEKMNAIDAMLEVVDPNGQLQELLSENPIFGSSVPLITALVAAAERFTSEASFRTGGQGYGGPMTPAEAKAEIDIVMNDRKHAYWNKTMSGHEEAVKRIAELHKSAMSGRK